MWLHVQKGIKESITLAKFVLNNKLSIQNTKGQRYVFDTSKLSGNTDIPTRGNDASLVNAVFTRHNNSIRVSRFSSLSQTRLQGACVTLLHGHM